MFGFPAPSQVLGRHSASASGLAGGLALRCLLQGRRRPQRAWEFTAHGVTLQAEGSSSTEDQEKQPSRTSWLWWESVRPLDPTHRPSVGGLCQVASSPCGTHR